MMIYQKLWAVLVFIVVVSNPVFAAKCESTFKLLDKEVHGIEVADANRIKKLIAVENKLFKAIEQCRGFSGMFVLMGELQIDMGQVPLAVVYGRKAVQMDGDYWRAYKLLGTAQMLNRESEQGLQALEQAHSLEPKNVNVQLNLIGAYVENKKHDKGIELASKIIEMNDHDTLSTAYYLRSKAHAAKGLIVEAKNDEKAAQSLGFVAR